jgi:tight adherence protein C
MDQVTLIIFGAFGAAVLVIFVITRALVGGGKDTKLHDRLVANPAHDPARDAGSSGPSSITRSQNVQGVAPILQRVGRAASKPFMPNTREKQSGLKRNLGYAGIYSAGAIRVMTGFKVILLGGGILGGYLFGAATDQLMMGLSVGGLLGYMLPTIWLKTKIKSNQKQLQYGLADGLDLMVVCVEAGLTVDAAMQRVGQELMIAHPAISREFAITYMETRVGLSRADAMKNLGARTGSPPLQSLAAMLTQADRFGTSIANALRIHADTLRQARQHAAEEMAAKAAVKMSFPLVLFIFPATFIVLAGPTVIGLMNSGML